MAYDQNFNRPTRPSGAPGVGMGGPPGIAGGLESLFQGQPGWTGGGPGSPAGPPSGGQPWGQNFLAQHPWLQQLKNRIGAGAGQAGSVGPGSSRPPVQMGGGLTGNPLTSNPLGGPTPGLPNPGNILSSAATELGGLAGSPIQPAPQSNMPSEGDTMPDGRGGVYTYKDGQWWGLDRPTR